MKYAILAVVWLSTIVGAFLAGSLWQLDKSSPMPTEFGKFMSTPKVEVLGDGRELKLLEDFIYVDPDETAWLAPAGRKVNGASIPRAFWTATGGPLSGRYRNASIVHDIECEDMKHDSTDVHQMFYHACLAGGVPERDAKKLYWAVLNFGPAWDTVFTTSATEYTTSSGHSVRYGGGEPVKQLRTRPTPTEEDIAWASSFFNENNPPIDAIPHIRREALEEGQ